MTKDARMISEVVLAKKRNVLGAGRTAAIAKVLKKYRLSDGQLRARCLGHSGCDYWIA